MSEKDQENQASESATDSSKESKAKASSKEATRKKAAKKKVSKKKVATKAKAVRKKAAVRKKGIHLKPETSSLDSFAEHAATEESSAEDVLEQIVQDKDVEINSINISKLNAKSDVDSADETVSPAPMEKTEKPVAVSDSANTSGEATTAEPAEQTEPPESKMSDTSEDDDTDRFILKLVVIVVLFLGFAFYVQSVFEQNSQPADNAEVEAVVIDTKATQPADPVPPAVTDKSILQPSLEQVVTPVVVIEPEAIAEKTPELVPETMPEPVKPQEKAVVLEQTVITSDAVRYPPPPAPAYLVMPKQPKPLPEDQMELIKQTFAPEYFK